MSYDYSALDGKITEIYKTRAKFANAIGFSERTLSLKMNGKVSWKQKEISKTCDLLGIPDNKINCYFFKIKVQ